jgi:hypothetical protein
MRPYLAGPVVFSEPTDFGRRLCAVGADSMSLSFAGTTAAAPDLGQGRLIRRNTCKLAVDLFGKTGASLRLGARLIEISSDSVRLTAKLIDAVPSAWVTFVPPVDVANSVTVSTKDLVIALERCLAVINNLAGDVTKKAASVTLQWDTRPELRVSFGHDAPSVRDVLPAITLAGTSDITINPRTLLRLLDGHLGVARSSITLSSSEPGTPLRIDAGPDRFVVLSQIRDVVLQAEAKPVPDNQEIPGRASAHPKEPEHA